jgi:hypothetical protein
MKRSDSVGWIIYGQADRMTIHLKVDTLEYEWVFSTDGKIYALYSKFSYKRSPKHDNV